MVRMYAVHKLRGGGAVPRLSGDTPVTHYYKENVSQMKALVDKEYQIIYVQEVQNTIKKLDSIFNKKTSFAFSPMSFFTAQHYKGHILIEGNENALHPQIIAHEYAHRITRRRVGKDPHTKTYFEHYKLICTHLGIEPIYMSRESCENVRQDLNLLG